MAHLVQVSLGSHDASSSSTTRTSSGSGGATTCTQIGDCGHVPIEASNGSHKGAAAAANADVVTHAGFAGYAIRSASLDGLWSMNGNGTFVTSVKLSPSGEYVLLGCSRGNTDRPVRVPVHLKSSLCFCARLLT